RYDLVTGVQTCALPICIIVELKAVECLTALHKAQLHTYLKLMNYRLGLLINFNCPYSRTASSESSTRPPPDLLSSPRLRVLAFRSEERRAVHAHVARPA